MVRKRRNNASSKSSTSSLRSNKGRKGGTPEDSPKAKIAKCSTSVLDGTPPNVYVTETVDLYKVKPEESSDNVIQAKCNRVIPLIIDDEDEKTTLYQKKILSKGSNGRQKHSYSEIYVFTDKSMATNKDQRNKGNSANLDDLSSVIRYSTNETGIQEELPSSVKSKTISDDRNSFGLYGKNKCSPGKKKDFDLSGKRKRSFGMHGKNQCKPVSRNSQMETEEKEKMVPCNFVCKLCSSEFSDSQTCFSHIIDNHTTIATNKKCVCQICWSSFTYSHTLRTHVMNKHVYLNSEQGKCEASSAKTEKFVIEMDYAEDVKPVIDKKGNVVEVDQKIISQKIGDDENGKNVKSSCSFNDSNSSNQSALKPSPKLKKRIRRRTTVVIKHKCEKCEKWSPKKYFILRHMIIHTSEDRVKCRQFLCQICRRKMKNTPSLKRHLLKKHIITEYPQTMLKKKLLEKINVNEKEKRPTMGDVPIKRVIMRYNCECCSLILHSKPALSKHSSSHIHLINGKKRDKAYKCEKCSKLFKTLKEACDHFDEEHFLINCYAPSHFMVGSIAQNEGKIDPALPKEQINYYFQCHACSKIFLTRHDITTHMSMYTKYDLALDKSKCKLCDNSFSLPIDATRHMTKHFLTVAYKQTIVFKQISVE
ncbi:zinc finger protein 28 [Patella vulgata]|uniref:zinc finger protein 28 n=1 Tax=Patella vulgata TaxID=6465 RepID=UPI0024A9E8E3|nr:zinc finger protein 28 [Patella vulgata]